MFKKAKKFFSFSSKTKDSCPNVTPPPLHRSSTPPLQKSSRRDLEDETPFGPSHSAKSAKSNESFGSDRGSKKHSRSRRSSLKDEPCALHQSIDDLDFLALDAAKKSSKSRRGQDVPDKKVSNTAIEPRESTTTLDTTETQEIIESVSTESINGFQKPALSGAWGSESSPESKIEACDANLVTAFVQANADSNVLIEESVHSNSFDVETDFNTVPSIQDAELDHLVEQTFVATKCIVPPLPLNSVEPCTQDVQLDQLVEQTFVSSKCIVPPLPLTSIAPSVQDVRLNHLAEKCIVPPLPLKSIETLFVEDVADIEASENNIGQETLVLKSNPLSAEDKNAMLHVELEVPEAMLRFELTMPSEISKSYTCDEPQEHALQTQRSNAEDIPPETRSAPYVTIEPSSIFEPNRVFVAPSPVTDSIYGTTDSLSPLSAEGAHAVDPIRICVESRPRSATPDVTTPTQLSNENAEVQSERAELLVVQNSDLSTSESKYNEDIYVVASNSEQDLLDIKSPTISARIESKQDTTTETTSVIASIRSEESGTVKEEELAAVSIVEGDRTLMSNAGASAYAKLLERCADRFMTDIELVMRDRKFAIAVCRCPLIGDRHAHLPISAAVRQQLVTELQVEDCSFDFPNDSIELRQSVLQAFLQEPRISSAVNAAQLAKDETRRELVTFTRILHDTLANPPESVRKWTYTCWRWLKLPQDYSISTLIAFPSFTSATRDTSTVWRQLSSYAGSNTLAAFSQQHGQGPVDVSRFSKSPNDFEVIYPLGQQFRVAQIEEWSFPDLQRELGTEGAFDDGQFPKTVLHLVATDAFYEIASDLYRVGECKVDGVAVLEARLAYERSLGGEPHRALLYLGRARKEMGDLDAAENCMQDALHIRKQRGVLETTDGSGLLMSLGMVKFDQGYFEEAVYYYSEAKAVLARIDNLRSVGGATLMASLGTTKRALRDLDGALAALREAEEIYRYLGSLKTPTGAALIASIARTYHDMQEYEKALREYVRSKQLAEATDSLWTANGGVLMTSIGTILRTLGDCASALKAYEKARSILVKTGTLETPGGAALLTSIGTSRQASQNLIGSFVAHKEATSLHHRLGLDDVPFGMFAWDQLQAVTDACSACGYLDEAMSAWEDYCVRGAEAWQDYMVPQAFTSTPTSPISASGHSCFSTHREVLPRVTEEQTKADRNRTMGANTEFGLCNQYDDLYFEDESSDDDQDVESNVSV